MGHDLSIGIGPSTSDFLKLGIRQADVAHVLNVVQERTGSSVLIVCGQPLNLLQSLIE
ncbi:hypothetical protein ACQR1Y_33050 [Bradyrhizobium sp. HKCCYLRH3099]|uniref:hypothetical protein n=1 Tax=unclassified Bradyrhizobium TaxID=2631580 RepID=UPI003EBBC4E7